MSASAEKAHVIKKKHWRISPVWFLPFTALLLAIWLGYETYTNRGVKVKIRFNTGSGMTIAKTKVMYKGIAIGKVKDVEINKKNIQQVIVTVELDKRTEPYLRSDTQFWLVKPSIALGGISGLDTLVSGNYIALRPGTTGPLKTDYVALKEPPPEGLLGTGLQLNLQTKDKGSLVTGSPVYYKKIRVGEVVGSYLSQEDDSVSVLLNIEEEYANLVTKQSRFYNVSGIRVNAGLSGLKVETESLAAVVMGGIAFFTPSDSYLKEPAQAGDKFPLFPSFETADVGIPVILHLANGDDIQADMTRIQYNGFNIGVIKKIEADFNTGKIKALAYIDPSAEELLREDSKIWKVEPKISLQGISELGTLIKGVHLEIAPGQGLPSTEFEVLSEPPLMPSSQAGLHLIAKSEKLGSLDIGSKIYYKNITIGTVQQYQLQSDNSVQMALHIKPEYQNLIRENSRFYHSSGVSIKGGLTGFSVKTESFLNILSGGITLFNPDKQSSKVKSGHSFKLHEDFDAAEAGIQVSLYFDDASGLQEDITEVNYKGINLGRVTDISIDSKLKKIKAKIKFDPQAKSFLKKGTQFWLVRPRVSINGVSGLKTLVSGNYITLRPGTGKYTRVFDTLSEEPPPGPTEPGLHLKLKTQELGSISVDSPVLYHQLPVGKVTAYELSRDNSHIVVNLLIDKKYRKLVTNNSRFYAASGIKVSGGITDLSIRTESLTAVLKGGIGFITPAKDSKSRSVNNGHQFDLLEDIQAAKENTFPITITFENALGIKEGTVIKYQGIQVGKVKRLRFFTDLKQVVADVAIDNVVRSVLGEKSRFWLVKAEFGLASTKNLETLIAGNYIQLEPVRGKSTRHFRALKESPNIQPSDRGLNLQLKTARLGSIKINQPIYYRQLKVGQVSGYQLSDTADYVLIHINIENRYARLVQRNSKFWNAGGINLDINLFADSKIKTETVQAILEGGISFATPDISNLEDLNSKQRTKKMFRRARNNSVFELHDEVDLKWLEWQPQIPLKNS